jgi:hypothetical protein
MTTTDDLLAEIFEGRQTRLYREFGGWLRDSRRFTAFAGQYRGKIRAKLKRVRGQSGMLDLAAELQTASLLLAEDRFTVEYEKYAATRQRGPDFTVTFKTHTLFNVEVRRIAGAELEESGDAATVKLMSVLWDKVGQVPAGMVNLLWLAAESEIAEADVARAAAILRQLAEHKAEDFFTRRGFESAAVFLKQYRRLSGVVLHRLGANAVWLNSLAQHKAPPEIVNALLRL